MVLDKCVTLNRVSHKDISGGGAPGVGDRRRGGRGNQRLVGGGSSLYQLMSAYRHPTSARALYTHAPLSLTITEEMGNIPS